MHYYQFNIGDYARDTGHLTVVEHGIYRLLLDWCYLNEKAITTEQAVRVGRGFPTETQSVLSEFFSQTTDGWIHKRVQLEVQSYHRKSETNKRNGAKGGRPKATDNPVGLSSDSESKANQTLTKEPKNQRTNNQETNGEAQRKRNAPHAIACPADVDDQTWTDWLSLRKKKGAPVTQTVVNGAAAEAAKAGITLGDFLKIWCLRGSQGLQADWLKPHERQGAGQQPAETAYQRSMRERMQQAAPEFARRDPSKPMENVIEFFATEVKTQQLEIGHEPTPSMD